MGGLEIHAAPGDAVEPGEHLCLVSLFFLDGGRGIDAADAADLFEEPARPGKADGERVHAGRAEPPLEVFADRPECRFPEDVYGGEPRRRRPALDPARTEADRYPEPGEGTIRPRSLDAAAFFSPIGLPRGFFVRRTGKRCDGGEGVHHPRSKTPEESGRSAPITGTPRLGQIAATSFRIVSTMQVERTKTAAGESESACATVSQRVRPRR